MHHVRHDVVEQSLVVGDDKEAAVRRAHQVDPLRHDLERVDVQAGVGLVHHAVLRTQHRHLQDLAALFLASGETFVERAGRELAVDLQLVHLFIERLVVLHRIDLLTLGQPRLQRRPYEIRDAHPRDLQRILEGEEEPGVRNLVRLLAEDALAVEQDFARLDFIVLVPCQNLGQRALASPVRPHQRVNLPFRNGQVEVLQDFQPLDRGGQVLDLKRAHICSVGCRCVSGAAGVDRGPLPENEMSMWSTR